MTSASAGDYTHLVFNGSNSIPWNDTVTSGNSGLTYGTVTVGTAGQTYYGPFGAVLPVAPPPMDIATVVAAMQLAEKLQRRDERLARMRAARAAREAAKPAVPQGRRGIALEGLPK